MSISVITYNINYQVTDSKVSKCIKNKENICIGKLKKFFLDFPYDVILLQEATKINKYIPRSMIKISIESGITKSESMKEMIDSIHIIYNPDKFGIHKAVYAGFTEENEDFIDRPFLVAEFENFYIVCVHSSHFSRIQKELFTAFEVRLCKIQSSGNNFKVKRILGDIKTFSLSNLLRDKNYIIGGDFNTQNPIIPFIENIDQQKTMTKTCCNRNFSPIKLLFASDHIFSNLHTSVTFVGQNLVKAKDAIFQYKLKYKVEMLSDHLPVVKFLDIMV